jgi:hypothetical protein
MAMVLRATDTETMSPPEKFLLITHNREKS